MNKNNLLKQIERMSKKDVEAFYSDTSTNNYDDSFAEAINRTNAEFKELTKCDGLTKHDYIDLFNLIQQFKRKVIRRHKK